MTECQVYATAFSQKKEKIEKKRYEYTLSSVDMQYLYGLHTEITVFFKFDLPDDFFHSSR